MKISDCVKADVYQATVDSSPAHRATLCHRRRKVAEKRLHECSGLSWGTPETLSCVSDRAVTCMGGFILFLFLHCLLHKWRQHKGAYPTASRYASCGSAVCNKVAGKVHKIWRRHKRAMEKKVFHLKLWCLVYYYLICGKLYRARTRFKKKLTLLVHHIESVYMKAAYSVYHRLPPLRVSAVVIFLWLFMSGDVELNPGPGKGYLTSDDLRVVRKAVWDARSKWFTLGIELKMSVTSLEAIKQRNKENPDDCLTEMLLEWLKQANPKPTWSCIVIALRESTVGLGQLAESIENQHLEVVHDNCDFTVSESEASCSSGIKLGKRRTRDKLSFPHIDEIAPDKEQRKALEERLQIESKEIMFKFYILINKFFDSLEEQALPVQKLERYLRMPLQTKKLTITSVEDAQKVIEDNSSFYDYQLVEYMIEITGAENDKQALHKYKESFTHYAQRRVFECPARLATRTSGDVKLMIKLDSHYKCKLAELKEFQERVCHILNIPFYASKLHCVKKGCFQITFLIPSDIQKTAFPLTPEQKFALAELKVLHLVCGKYQEVFGKTNTKMDFALDSESDSDNDCDNSAVKSMSTEVDDHILNQLNLEEANTTSSVEQVADIECISRSTRRPSIARSERRRQAGRSSKSPISSPSMTPPLRMSPIAWNFDAPVTPPLRTSPTAWNFDSTVMTLCGMSRMYPINLYSSFRIPAAESAYCNPSRKDYSVSLSNELLTAAANGDVSTVAMLINQRHFDVLYKDSEGNSALHYAAKYGHLYVIKCLIKHGAHLTDRGQDEMTPLHIASKFGHIRLVHFLVDECAINPCCHDLKKRTPFFVACMYGHLKVAQYLLQTLLNYMKLEDIVNSTDIHGATVVHTACKMGHIEILRWLIKELNCDPNIPGTKKRKPLHYAAENGHVHISEYLIEDHGCNPSCADINEVTPLFLASLNGQVEVVRYLTLKKHCDPMCKDNKNSTPLHAAAFNGHIIIVKFFISTFNCNPSFPDEESRTPLHYAAVNGHLHVVKHLIEKEDCDPACMDRNKVTPLHLASMKGHLDTIKYLVLDHKYCDPKVRNSNNETPLHTAAINGHLEVVKFLICELNCDPNTPGWKDTNRTPLHHAAQEGHLHIVKYLIEEQDCDPACLNRNKVTPLYLASIKGYLDTAKYLTLEKCCDPMSRINNCNTPLHAASLHGHLEVVKLFISTLKCDPNVPGFEGITPFHYAIHSGNINLVKYMIEDVKCNLQALDNFKRAPIMAASTSLPCLRYLCEKGYDPTVTDMDGETVLHFATEKGVVEIVDYLIKNWHFNPNTPGLTNRTPLHCAAEFGHLILCQHLIREYDCKATITDANGDTALNFTALQGHLDALKYFTLDLNCDPMQTDNYGNTILHDAARNGHLEVVKFLVETLHCPINTKGSCHMTPLEWALFKGHFHIVKYLNQVNA